MIDIKNWKMRLLYGKIMMVFGIVFVTTTSVNAQSNDSLSSPKKMEIVEDTPVQSPDHKAAPLDGLTEFYKYIAHGLASAGEYNPAEFKVKFIVEKDGELTNFNIVHIQGEGMENVAKQVVDLMKVQKWKPAEHQGQIVRSSYTFPVRLNFN